MKKIYKEPNKSETETTINVLYSENILSICTNKVDLQKKLNKLLGEPAKEHKIKRSILKHLPYNINPFRRYDIIICRASVF